MLCGGLHPAFRVGNILVILLVSVALHTTSKKGEKRYCEQFHSDYLAERPGDQCFICPQQSLAVPAGELQFDKSPYEDNDEPKNLKQ